MAANAPHKLQVFVSSTYKDLREDRQAAVSAILKAGHIPAGMELFTAGDRSQLDVIKRWIDECDIFMLILAGRYGSIEPDSKLSYTEVEYDYAISKGKPFFAVVIEETALKDRVQRDGGDSLEQDETKKFKAFRQKVTGKMCSFFHNNDGIELAILRAIPDLERQHSLPGWVHGSSVPDATGLINEISRLNQENTVLREQLKRMQKVVQNLPRHSEETKLQETAFSLAKTEVWLPPQSSLGHKTRNEINELCPFVEAEFTMESSLPKLNSLVAFLYLAPLIIAGVKGYDNIVVGDVAFSGCFVSWFMEELLEKTATSNHKVLYNLTSRGKSLLRMLRDRQETWNRRLKS